MTTKQNQRLPWVDVLRVAALMMVVGAHAVDIYNATPQSDPMAGWWGGTIGSAMRACVPLFAMMTGLLLLPCTEAPSKFYAKRITRVAVPAVLWSVIYCLVPWIVGVCGGGTEIIQIFFPFEYAPSTELTAALKNIAIIPFTFGGYTTHIWYIYMLVGLYFVIPFVSKWLDDRTLTRTAVVLWALSLAVPYVEWIVGGQVLGECAWNAFGMFQYFGGFVGYMIVGKLLAERPTEGPAWRTIVLGVVMFTVGFIVTQSGQSSMAAKYDYAENPAMLELFWQYCSPNVALMTLGVFIIVRRVQIRSKRTQAVLAHFTRCSFGSYLVHYLFIGPFTMLLAPLGLPVPAGVALTVVLVVASSWATSALLHKITGRAAKYIVG